MEHMYAHELKKHALIQTLLVQGGEKSITCGYCGQSWLVYFFINLSQAYALEGYCIMHHGMCYDCLKCNGYDMEVIDYEFADDDNLLL